MPININKVDGWISDVYMGGRHFLAQLSCPACVEELAVRSA
jgi:hypothetical protein